MQNSNFGTGQLVLACCLLVVFSLAAPAAAQNAKAGRTKAQKCALCHGIDGVAVASNAPNLAGENAVYIVTQLKAFRGGKRKHEQMSIIAGSLTDQDIADLAQWYSLIKVTTKLPELD